MLLSKFRNRFLAMPRQTRSIVGTILIGAVGALVAVSFHWVIQLIFGFVYEGAAELPFWEFAGKSFAVITVATLIAGILVSRFAPDAAGSGVPQMKLAYWKDFGKASWRTVWVKFIGGALTVGSGVSLGREGPTVQIAGSLTSKLAGVMGTAKQGLRHPTACGAAAGLSAAFNAPLAATTFVLEEIVQDLNSRALGKILLASLVGAFVVWALVGPDPAFELRRIESLNSIIYLLIPLVAAVAAVMGWAFQVGALYVRKISVRQRRYIPQFFQPVLGGWVTWALGIWVFAECGHLGIFGLGHHDLTEALAHNLPWKIALVLLLGKMVATAVAYGLSGCGGIFSPTLFIGGMTGATIAGVLQEPLNLQGDDMVMLAAIGMSACLGAVVRAPMTTILIVFEMTHEFYVVPGLMLGTLVSQAVGRTLTKHNFYESLLRQDGYDMDKVVPPRDLQSWQNLPIAAIMNFELVALRSYDSAAMKELLESTELRRFPVVIDGELKGVVSRPELCRAFTEERPPDLAVATTIEPRQTVREAQAAIIRSSMDIVVVTNPEGETPVLGVVTLHDILRVQMKMADTH